MLQSLWDTAHGSHWLQFPERLNRPWKACYAKHRSTPLTNHMLHLTQSAESCISSHALCRQ